MDSFFELDQPTSVVNLPNFSIATPALLVTTDEATEGFIEEVQSLHPDGYLVGVGVGGVFSLLQCYPERTSPKGIVLADINPHVVVAGKVMVTELERASGPDDFYNNFFRQTTEDYQRKVELILSTEPELRTKIKEWEGETGTPMDAVTFPNRYLNIPSIIRGKFELLKRLASSGKIVTIYGDFTDPAFIDSVHNLPNFSSVTNIIYLTNIPDYLDIHGEGLKRFENLRKFDSPEHPPVWVYAPTFIDQKMTVSRTLDEVIRLHTLPLLKEI